MREDDLPRNVRGQRVCGAKARQSPTGRCRSTALGPSGRCRMHNGWAVSGLQHPGYKKGRFGKYRKPIQAFVDDPTALELRTDAGILNARRDELVEVVGREDAVTLAGIEASWRRVAEAAASRDPARVQAAFTAHGELLVRARREADTWVEIERLTLAKAAIVERETRRLERAASSIPAEAAWALVEALQTAVREHVADPTVRRLVADAIARAMRPVVH